jgi:hypothetical protein
MISQEFFALVLAGFALVLVSAAFGAALMWRLVHLPRQPPALPIWVSSLLLVGGAFWIVAAAIAEQWLGVVSGVLISLTFGIQFAQSLRRGSASDR